MPAPGTDFNHTMAVAAPPDHVLQLIVAAASGAAGYEMAAVGPQNLVLTRRYIPTWAIVVAIIGSFFFLLGLLALLASETEALNVSLAPVPGGTRLMVTGRGTPELLNRIGAVVNSLSVLESSDPPAPQAIGAATKRCPECAEEIKAAANVCRFCGFQFIGGATAAATT
jgi:hypothetical protein